MSLPKAPQLPELNLGSGITLTSYKGPGTYTLSPGNIVTVNPFGRFSFLTGSGPNGVTGGNVALPTVQLGTATLPSGNVLTNYAGPGLYTLAPGSIISIGSNGAISTIPASTMSLPKLSLLPNVNLGSGITLSSYRGPGTYTLSPGNVLSVGPSGQYSFISGSGANGEKGGNVNLPSLSLATATLPNGAVLTNYAGPGQYTLSPGNVISIDANGVVSSINLSSISLPKFSPLPSLNLANGVTLTSYKGPGTYTLSPGNVVSVNPFGQFSFISGNANGVTNGNVNLPAVTLGTATLPEGDVLTNYAGPGRYTLGPGKVISIDSNGGISTINLSSISLPTFSPLPSLNLANGVTLTSYKGPGTYTLSPGNVVSVNPFGQFSFISGNANGVTNGNVNLPAVTLGTATLPEGDVLTNYAGPGRYTLGPGKVISIDSNGAISSVQGISSNIFPGGSSFTFGNGGSSFPSNGGSFTFGNGGSSFPSNGGSSFTFPSNGGSSFTFGNGGSSISFPSISLPRVDLPTLDLGDGVSIGSYKGPGVYTLSPGNVVSVGAGGLFSFLSGSGSNGVVGGHLTLPTLSLPTVSLDGGVSLEAFTGPGVYTYSPGNTVSIDSNGGVNWLQGGPSKLPSGGFTFPSLNLPSVTLPSLNLPTLNLGSGISVPNFSGPGIYTVSPGNVLSIGPDGDYSYVLGSGSLGSKTGHISLPSINLPSLSLSGGITLPSFSGAGVYTLNGNVLSINSKGGFSWVHGGPSTLPGGGISLPSINLSGALPTPSGTVINGVNFKFPFDVPGFTGPGFYSLSPGNVVQVRPDGTYSFVSGGPPSGTSGGFTFPSISLPSVSLPSLSLGGGLNIGTYKGPGVYTLSPGNVVSVDAGGSFSFLTGSGPNGSASGSLTLPTLSLPSLSLDGGISLGGFSGPGVYTHSPGNVVSIDANGGVNWLQGGPKKLAGGGFTFPAFTLPSITLPSLNLPTLNLGVGINLSGFSGPGIYTLSPGNVISLGANGDYSYVLGSGLFGAKNGHINLPTISLPSFTLAGGITVPSYSGAGVYTVNGNVLSINPKGGFSWINGGPSTLPGGGITLPSINLSGGATPTGTLINGVNFKFPFNIPNFNGPGFYVTSPGNVVQVRPDGSYNFVFGGPAGSSSANLSAGFSFPSITLPQISFPTLNLGGGISIGNYKGPGVYTLGPGRVVSIAAGGGFSFLSGFGANGAIAGALTLPTLSLPTISLDGGIHLDGFTGAGVYTYSPGNTVSIDGSGGVNWLKGGPIRLPSGGFTFPGFNLPSITLPSLNLPSVNLGIGINIPTFTGAGIYTVSPGNVLSMAANGAYTYLAGGGFLGAQTGKVTLPSLNLPSITLSGGIQVPNFSGAGIYTVNGNVLSINAGGGFSWIRGGPSSLSGGGFTLPSINLSGSLPTGTVMNGVEFKFPFDIPKFNGPGYYSLSPGNVVRVRADGTYNFVSGGPPSGSGSGLSFNFPSIRLPSINLPSLSLGGGINIPGYKGPGVYTLDANNVVSIRGDGSFSFLIGGSANGGVSGHVSLPYVSLPSLSLAGGISLANFGGPGTYTYSPGNVVSVDSNGGINWLQGGPQLVSGGGFEFPNLNLPTISLPRVQLPQISVGNGLGFTGYTGSGIYTLNNGNIISLGGNGEYSYISGSGSFGALTGSLNLPQLNLPTLSLSGGISVPKFSGPGLYTVSPGNILSIGSSGQYDWLQGGPQTQADGRISLPSGGFSNPTKSIINGVKFDFPFNVPNFSGPGFYLLSPGNILQVRADGSFNFVAGGPPHMASGYGISFPTISLPRVNLPNLNVAGVSLSSYKGPGIYTLGSGIVSIRGDGGFSFLAGGGANGAVSGSLSLPTLSLSTLNLYGGITLNNFGGPGVYTYKPGNVVSIDSRGYIDWLEGGPVEVPGGGYSFTGTGLPSISLPRVSLPSINLGLGIDLTSYSGPGIYTLGSGNVISLNSDGSYKYLQGSGFLGASSGNINLPRLNLPTITLSGGVSVPSYSGPGIYTVSPGNVLSIGVTGGYSWIQGGPQTLENGAVTLPTGNLEATFRYINGVRFEFPFNVPNFDGPGYYSLSPGNVIRVNADGSWRFVLGGPNSLPSLGGGFRLPTFSINLPTLSFASLYLPGNVPIDPYTGPGLYSVGFNSLVSISADGQYSYLQGNGMFGIIAGSVSLPTLTGRLLSLPGGFNIPNYTGPGIYTPSAGNIVSIGVNGAVSWLQGGAGASIGGSGSGSIGGALTFPNIQLPTISLGNANVPSGGTITSYSGAGIYTLNANTIIEVGSGGSYSYIKGSGLFGVQHGVLVFPPAVNFPTVSLQGGFKIMTYKGPGVYTVGTGNVVSISPSGGVSWLQGGPRLKAANVIDSDPAQFSKESTPSSQGFVLPSFSLPSFSKLAEASVSVTKEHVKRDNQNNFFKNVLSLF
ncbi:uncharacterized protein EV154DRAFT_503079 [Mucor mucedo]|uniref:uncharacterized protein n=1 Tax=Mucor mucedo TaxID=29922 RepID=UPI00221E52F8|nr:uncharacterized protein EV154DRAFT_503079 [Mucor mucedo]KAI7893044.1 hypothetical protein EV154DRAFT_503079 [Mucor mucedo]